MRKILWLLLCLFMVLPVAAQEESPARNIEDIAHPFTGSESDYQFLVEKIGDAEIVMIGEASHGTHEFYQIRADITRYLIEEKGFDAVIVEADWPAAFRVNEYVRNLSDDTSVEMALSSFERFPRWMWRNTVMVNFVEWLRQYNQQVSPEQQAGFYGFDLYSLYESIDEVVGYLDEIDPEAAERARQRYACFEGHDNDPHRYGSNASSDEELACTIEAEEQVIELQNIISRSSRHFMAVQNARVIANAEEYYRGMFNRSVNTWNLRDTHMFETVEFLRRFLQTRGQDAKIVVWAHNSHLGDARATEMGESGQLNVGQLLHEAYGNEVVGIGFSTYTGTVTAANDWNMPAECKQVNPGMAGSYEALFHETGMPGFVLDLRETEALPDNLLERAIGVIYRPQTERVSHYFHADIAAQFDLLIFIDETSALVPLDDVPVCEQAASTS